MEVASACGPRSQMKRRKGKFGYGAYADESWSLQAFQKRVYAVRDVYGVELKDTSIENPGWDDAVCGVLGALAKLRIPRNSDLFSADVRESSVSTVGNRWLKTRSSLRPVDLQL